MNEAEKHESEQWEPAPDARLLAYAKALRRREDGLMMIAEDGSVGLDIANALDELVRLRHAKDSTR